MLKELNISYELESNNYKKALNDYESGKSWQETKQELHKALKKLDFMPYKFRKSLAFDDENVRDFIFKGYVIPYKIDKEKDLIIILGIYKENLPNF
ncbi:type II toxin-antitoxin system RelE/ParE family toxin [Campylobacter coli]|uniref:type II toxin-antitoxin system RelE/ParE family toxin n=1 Tax=Campylobacter coli TaxID=195 RepID=UPI00389A37C1